MKTYVNGVELEQTSKSQYWCPDFGVWFRKKERDGRDYWGVKYAPWSGVIGYYATIEEAVAAATEAENALVRSALSTKNRFLQYRNRKG